MKVQLNKLGTEYTNLDSLKKSLESKYRFPDNCGIEEYRYDKWAVGYFCNHCGSELQGKWKKNYLQLKQSGDVCNLCPEQTACRTLKDILYEKENKVFLSFIENYNDEQLSLANLTHCPVCGAELHRERGHFFADVGIWGAKDIESFFYSNKEQYEKLFKLVNEDEIDKKIEQLILVCDITTPVLVPSGNIVAESSELKKYIHHLIEMEMGIYSLTKRLKTLYIQEVLSNRNVVASKALPKYNKKLEIELTEVQLQQWKKRAEDYKEGEIGLPLPIKPQPPVLATPSLLNKKKVLAENEALKEQYQADLQLYEDQVKIYEEEKVRLINNAESEMQKLKAIFEKAQMEYIQMTESNDDTSPAIVAKGIIDKEIEEAEALLKKLYECRNTLYSHNIVFEKYRNVVALSTFYEYLIAGRCTTLEGADGAYNIYENEIRADRIIGQLTQVIDKLDAIKDTQYMIYSELQTINKSLDHLNKTMDDALVSVQNMEKDIANISANTDVIAHNSAVTAYYSKLNAELTNSLGFMMALS